MDEQATATRYEFHLRGTVGEGLLGEFPELQARAGKNETILAGPLPDQAALHGVIGRIEAFGLELLEVRRGRTNGGAAADRRQLDPSSGRARAR